MLRQSWKSYHYNGSRIASFLFTLKNQPTIICSFMTPFLFFNVDSPFSRVNPLYFDVVPQTSLRLANNPGDLPSHWCQTLPNQCQWLMAGKLLESSLFWDVYDVWMVSNGQTILKKKIAYPMADQSKKRTARNVNSTWPTSGTVELSFVFFCKGQCVQRIVNVDIWQVMHVAVVMQEREDAGKHVPIWCIYIYTYIR